MTYEFPRMDIFEKALDTLDPEDIAKIRNEYLDSVHKHEQKGQSDNMAIDNSYFDNTTILVTTLSNKNIYVELIDFDSLATYKSKALGGSVKYHYVLTVKSKDDNEDGDDYQLSFEEYYMLKTQLDYYAKKYNIPLYEHAHEYDGSLYYKEYHFELADKKMRSNLG